jgi:hypothetical protein
VRIISAYLILINNAVVSISRDCSPAGGKSRCSAATVLSSCQKNQSQLCPCLSIKNTLSSPIEHETSCQ